MKHEDTICPKLRELLEKNKVRAATDCIPIGSGRPQIEVQSLGGSKYVVDLQARTCACRRWDLTGIPCKHVVAAINFMRHASKDYVDPCYLKKTYMVIYANTIKPVNGMELWSKSPLPSILSPLYNQQPGRPRTNKRKDSKGRQSLMVPSLAKFKGLLSFATTIKLVIIGRLVIDTCHPRTRP